MEGDVGERKKKKNQGWGGGRRLKDWEERSWGKGQWEISKEKTSLKGKKT